MPRLPRSLTTRRRLLATEYDPKADPVHGAGWNSAARWGGWHWRSPRDGDFFRTCSFCGCIHPGDLLKQAPGGRKCLVCGQPDWDSCYHAQRLAVAPAEAHEFNPGGWYASWADQKYGWPHKFYVHNLANPEPGRLFVVGSATGDEPSSGGGRWVHVSRLNRTQRRVARAGGYLDRKSGWKPEWFQFGTRRTLHAKFYSIHLADPVIGASVKDAIQRAAGVQFRFRPDGGVQWGPYGGRN